MRNNRVVNASVATFQSAQNDKVGNWTTFSTEYDWISYTDTFFPDLTLVCYYSTFSAQQLASINSSDSSSSKNHVSNTATAIGVGIAMIIAYISLQLLYRKYNPPKSSAGALANPSSDGAAAANSAVA